MLEGEESNIRISGEGTGSGSSTWARGGEWLNISKSGEGALGVSSMGSSTGTS